MLKSMGNVFAKLFGTKSDRDVKRLMPVVDKINEQYATLHKISNDELRGKTREFKDRIEEHLKDWNERIREIDKEVSENYELTPQEKEELFAEYDKLQKERDQELENILWEILPEAFAVVRETARRFTENETLEATPFDRERDLSLERDFLEIKNEKAIYKNSWTAGGAIHKWEMVHYDVQLIGGIVLHEGKISEMATGEGKTLVSTLPAYLNALSGLGVHIVTVNDYLARRDAEWMGPIFEFLGISVDCIEYSRPNTHERKQAYLCDITYGTNNEFGFDYLRDNMVESPENKVQRKLHYVMVDEIDSVLIDDARTPLIISGKSSQQKDDQEQFYELKPRVEKIYNAQKKYINEAIQTAKQKLQEGNEEEAGFWLLRCNRGLPQTKPLLKLLAESGNKTLMQKTENLYLQEQAKHMWKVDQELYFTIDEKNNQIELTDKGIDMITDKEEEENFFVLPDIGSKLAEIEEDENLPKEEKLEQKDKLMRDFAVKSERIHTVNQLLKAYALFEKDEQYIIQDGKIKIVDEQTGRVMEGRRYSDGLHQAIESKENVKVQESTQTFASITLQNFFRMYHKMSGMTGTAETEAHEFWQIYKLDVVVIPTHKDMVREDRPDLVYKTKKEKYNAIIEEIENLVNAGRPVLVGTTSVEVSELLSKMLKMQGVKHNLLNAKHHEQEAQIISDAGKPGAVTIATNMAGRGTDIKLGEGVKEAGGLAIIGSERHESRRIDRQLMGRAGRQGDPGSSQFFVSLEDNLLRIFGSQRIAKIMDRMGMEEGEAIQHSFINNSLERAQKKVEQNHFGQRKKLLEYDDVMNQQREVIYKRRDNALYGERLSLDLDNMLREVTEEMVSTMRENEDYETFKMELLRTFAVESPFTEHEGLNNKEEDLIEQLYQELSSVYENKKSFVAGRALPVIKDVYDKKGKQIKRIVVPFTDGQKTIRVVSNLERCVETEGVNLIRSFEKNATLAHIDEAWKDHLRELDDLKQSVQNARLEQKDPLIIYKFEAFKVFEDMLAQLNKDVLSMLFKGDILTKEPEKVQEAKDKPKVDPSSLQTSRQDVVPSGDGNQGQPQQAAAKPKTVKKVGRNEDCPCGSGKKYKHCHGK